MEFGIIFLQANDHWVPWESCTPDIAGLHAGTCSVVSPGTSGLGVSSPDCCVVSPGDSSLRFWRGPTRPSDRATAFIDASGPTTGFLRFQVTSPTYFSVAGVSTSSSGSCGVALLSFFPFFDFGFFDLLGDDLADSFFPWTLMVFFALRLLADAPLLLGLALLFALVFAAVAFGFFCCTWVLRAAAFTPSFFLRLGFWSSSMSSKRHVRQWKAGQESATKRCGNIFTAVSV